MVLQFLQQLAFIECVWHTVLSSFYLLTSLIPTTTPQSRCYYYASVTDVTDEKEEAKSGEVKVYPSLHN